MSTIMNPDGWLYPLLAWLSPAYPVGAFSYSHGLEWAVASGAVRDEGTLADYVAAVLERGAGWTDLVLSAWAWRAATADDEAALDEAADLAAAWRGTAETALESLQQGAAFVATTTAAWPGTALDRLARRRPDRPIAHATAVAVACSGRVPLAAAAAAYGQALAANLISAGVRLVPLGQTAGQRLLAALAPLVAATVEQALGLAIDDLGTAAPRLDLASMHHETQYTRLFRS